MLDVFGKIENLFAFYMIIVIRYVYMYENIYIYISILVTKVV